jgi:hypothetical protein
MAAGAMLAIGVIAGATVHPAPPLRPLHRSAPAFAARGASPFVMVGAQRLDPQLVYAIEVLRVIDGDTFAARVRVWPGLDVDTHVRLRDIDAARCASELRKALAARAALQAILAAGGVTIWHVGLDKYAGRVDAHVAARGGQCDLRRRYRPRRRRGERRVEQIPRHCHRLDDPGSGVPSGGTARAAATQLGTAIGSQ